ncbi:MAG: dipeptide/oligopeptide/nickel ABC transporter ATP-binding protein [Oscillospiraceae bacterium]|nr:dipeptide/oligopeptide/nickel ABC transporter ATP-binding protein [Oscillospiraceae bacterium]
MRLELLGVSKRYARIDDLTLTIEGERAVALVGESGSGKSTLARLISLLEKPDAGEIRFDGVSLTGLRGAKRRALRGNIQLILQNAAAALDPRVRVGKSIAEPLRNLTRLSAAEISARVNEICARVSLSPELLRRLPHELSGGQQKRVCFARGLVTHPGFVVFDEVTSGLDPALRERVLEFIVGLKAESLRSFLFITHDMDAALRVADRVLVMKSGAIVEDSIVSGGRAELRHEYARLLLEKAWS